ncbi:MAG TPA: hypothetical protein VF138_00625 [Caulobacteraceae bacterium]
MKTLPAALAVALLALGACDEIKKDPDVKEAGDALKAAAKDGGAGIRKVTNEVRDAHEERSDKPAG